MTGEPANGLRVGQPVTLLIHTADTHGNPRGRGGEDVTVELVGPESTTVSKVMGPSLVLRVYILRFKGLS